MDHSGAGDRVIFESNLRKFAPRAKVNIIQESSLNLKKVGFGNIRLRLLSIDGGHTAELTLNDLRLAECCMLRRGIVVLDDILNSHWLGVLSGLADYLHRNGKLTPFAISPNKVYLSTDAGSARFYRATLRRGFPLALQKSDVEFFGAPIDIYGDHPYYDRAQSAGLHCQLSDLRIEEDKLKSQVGALTGERDIYQKTLKELN